VVIARDSHLRPSGNSPDSKRYLNLVDRAFQVYFDREDPSEAWSRVVRPEMTVGIKVNCLAGLGMSTSVELVDIICERLQESGIKKNQIIIWDRLNRDLERADFKIRENLNSIRCYGNDHRGFESGLSVHGSVGSLLCRTLTRECDVVINLSILKDHGITGYTGALKNLFGAIHNPNKYHLNIGNPFIPDVWMLPGVKEKIRINICEAIDAQYHGGPSYMPQWIWPFNGIMLSEDPVALDFIGWRTLEEKRKKAGYQSLEQENREPLYIFTAADSEHRLGNASLDRINVIKTSV
jgi:uncharacterized protein (DUF362 family)